MVPVHMFISTGWDVVYANMHARATAKKKNSEPEFDVVSCASVMEAVQTMLRDHELLTECIKNCF